jgi:hypothetical protein
MFLLNGNRLPEGISFYDANGVQYGSGWLNQATEEQKLAIGITWVADAVRADDRFYWDGNINNPKALADKAEVREDNSPLLDDKGNQVITKGLKSNFIAQTKDTAGKLLAQTDWYVVRKAERNVDIPADIVTKRAAIVTEADRLETAIAGVTTVEALIEVLNAQNWSE